MAKMNLLLVMSIMMFSSTMSNSINERCQLEGDECEGYGDCCDGWCQEDIGSCVECQEDGGWCHLDMDCCEGSWCQYPVGVTAGAGECSQAQG